MKNLILLLFVFTSFSLFAQDDSNIAIVDNASDVWITKIASDSQLRGQMMELMIQKTKGNEEEMKKLVDQMLSDPETHKMIMASTTGRAVSENITVEPREIKSDNIKVGKVYSTEPVPVPKK